MTLIKTTIESAATEAALKRLADALEDPTPAMQDLGELLVRSTKQRFAAGESPDGVKWAPKSQTTLDRYGQRKSNRVDIRPLFGPSGALNSTIYYESGRNETLVGSPMIYAAVQHFGAAKGAFGQTSRGASIPWGDIPARQFLGISAEDEVNIVETGEDYLTGAIGS